MSNKRSQRNTKSFKKARARAGIPRQDLRSGGRVSLMEGSVTIGQNDDELTTTKTTAETTEETTAETTEETTPETTEETTPETTPETTEETTPVDTSDDMGSDAATKAKADAKKALEEADKAREEEEAIPKDYSLEIADLEAKKKKLEAASKRLRGTGHPGYGEDLADINRQLGRFNIRQQEYTDYQASQQDFYNYSSLLTDVSEEVEFEIKEAGKTVAQEIIKNPAIQGLTAKYTEILNSGMSPDDIQKALQDLGKESKELVIQLSQAPEFQNIPLEKATLERRGISGPGLPTAKKEEEEKEGIISRLIGGILESYIGEKLSSVIYDIGEGVFDWMGSTVSRIFNFTTGLFESDGDGRPAWEEVSGGLEIPGGTVVVQDQIEVTGGGTVNVAVDSDGDEIVLENNPVNINDDGELLDEEGEVIEDATVTEQEEDDGQDESDIVLDEDGIREGRIAGSQGEVFNEEGERDDRKYEVSTLLKEVELSPEEGAAAYQAYLDSDDYDSSKYSDYEAWLKDQPKKTVAPAGTITDDADIAKLGADYTTASLDEVSTDINTTVTAGTADTVTGIGRPFSPEELQSNWEGSEEYQQALTDADEDADQQVIDLETNRRNLLAQIKKTKGMGDVSRTEDLNEDLKKLVRRIARTKSRRDSGALAKQLVEDSYQGWLETAPKTVGGVGATTYEAVTGGVAADTDVAKIDTATIKQPTAAIATVTDTVAAERSEEDEAKGKASTSTFDKSAESEVARVDFRTGDRTITPEEYAINWKDSDDFKNIGPIAKIPELVEVETDRNKLATQLETASDEEKVSIQEQIDALDARAEQIKIDAQYTTPDGNVFETETEGKAYEEWLKTQPKETYNVAPTPELEMQEREVITGEPAPVGVAAKIVNEYGFGRSMKRVVKGAQAKENAAAELAETYDLEPELADKILEDVGAFDTENETQGNLGAIAALPREALVSTQMENLMAGMEDGKIPAWARPAVEKIEQNMAIRGLSVSTVGRDSLFNAIIQAAAPLAESNAKALQRRAEQNLDNEQQALIQDRNIAAKFLERNAEFAQEMKIANLSNDQQMRIANLESKNRAADSQMTSNDKRELANLNSKMQTNIASAEIAKAMGIAQLNADQQRAVENARINANIDLAKFDDKQKVELVNSKFVQTMVAKDLDNRQQAAIQDSLNTAAIAMRNADNKTRVSIEHAQNFLKANVANLNAEQQANMIDSQNEQQRLLSDQSAKNAALQFNAKNQTEVDMFQAEMATNLAKFNTQQLNLMEQFNVAETNKMAAIDAGLSSDAEKANAQLGVEVSKFNAALDDTREKFNTTNSIKVQQANVEWMRKMNTIDTAAQNAINSQNAQNAVGISMQDTAFLWQELRDIATRDFQTNISDEEKMVAIMNTAFASETWLTDAKYKEERKSLGAAMEEMFGLNLFGDE